MPQNPPALTAHLLKAGRELFVLPGANQQPCAFVGIALEFGRVPGKLRPLAILLGGRVECGFVLVHANYQAANRLKNA